MKEKEKITEMKDFEKVLERLENGEAIRNILKDETIDISKSDFYRKIQTDNDLWEQYARAKEEGIDHYIEEHIIRVADEAVLIADNSSPEDAAKVRTQLEARRLNNMARMFHVTQLQPKAHGINSMRVGSGATEGLAITITPVKSDADDQVTVEKH